MKTYKQFQPTALDCKGLNAEKYNIGDFYVLCAQNRDSDCLARSNFECILSYLGGENEKVQVHRFGHWANGWFELILIHPDLLEQGNDIEEKLNNYPVFNDDHYFNLQWNEGSNYWDSLSMRERIEYCKEVNISIFQARSELVPEKLEEKIIYSL